MLNKHLHNWFNSMNLCACVQRTHSKNSFHYEMQTNSTGQQQQKTGKEHFYRIVFRSLTWFETFSYLRFVSVRLLTPYASIFRNVARYPSGPPPN